MGSRVDRLGEVHSRIDNSASSKSIKGLSHHDAEPCGRSMDLYDHFTRSKTHLKSEHGAHPVGSYCSRFKI